MAFDQNSISGVQGYKSVNVGEICFQRWYVKLYSTYFADFLQSNLTQSVIEWESKQCICFICIVGLLLLSDSCYYYNQYLLDYLIFLLAARNLLNQNQQFKMMIKYNVTYFKQNTFVSIPNMQNIQQTYKLKIVQYMINMNLFQTKPSENAIIAISNSLMDKATAELYGPNIIVTTSDYNAASVLQMIGKIEINNQKLEKFIIKLDEQKLKALTTPAQQIQELKQFNKAPDFLSIKEQRKQILIDLSKFSCKTGAQVVKKLKSIQLNENESLEINEDLNIIMTVYSKYIDEITKKIEIFQIDNQKLEISVCDLQSEQHGLTQCQNSAEEKQTDQKQDQKIEQSSMSYEDDPPGLGFNQNTLFNNDKESNKKLIQNMQQEKQVSFEETEEEPPSISLEQSENNQFMNQQQLQFQLSNSQYELLKDLKEKEEQITKLQNELKDKFKLEQELQENRIEIQTLKEQETEFRKQPQQNITKQQQEQKYMIEDLQKQLQEVSTKYSQLQKAYSSNNTFQYYVNESNEYQRKLSLAQEEILKFKEQEKEFCTQMQLNNEKQHDQNIKLKNFITNLLNEQKETEAKVKEMVKVFNDEKKTLLEKHELEIKNPDQYQINQDKAELEQHKVGITKQLTNQFNQQLAAQQQQFESQIQFMSLQNQNTMLQYHQQLQDCSQKLQACQQQLQACQIEKQNIQQNAQQYSVTIQNEAKQWIATETARITTEFNNQQQILKDEKQTLEVQINKLKLIVDKIPQIVAVNNIIIDLKEFPEDTGHKLVKKLEKQLPKMISANVAEDKNIIVMVQQEDAEETAKIIRKLQIDDKRLNCYIVEQSPIVCNTMCLE
ncbi:Hypothetical_protein [Hexamita inflata]|uniref:Hypothetical_protein n=1 Tax=Hexamita inflata TaxID=28002 RepID=A0ABP1HAH9_9EUKA